MGLREEIQSEVAAAFDEDLADAVSDFSGSYVTHRHRDPVTETGGESTAIYTGRGVLTRYKLGRIDGINILHGDLKLTALVCEVTDKPAGNDSNLLIVFYVQIMPDDFVMQLHRF